MVTVRHTFGQAVIDCARSLRKTTRQARRPGIDARSCVDRPSTLHVRDGEGRATARATPRGNGYVLVEVVGAIDISFRPELADVLTEAVDSGPPTLIVDLSAVTLLAAAGLGCLQEAAALLAARDGRLHLVCPPGSPAARVLRLLDPHDGWPRHRNVSAAVATVGRG